MRRSSRQPGGSACSARYPRKACGGGPHFCLGRHLAALDLRVLLQALTERMPGIRLDSEPSRLRSNFINGIKHMPVRF
jgi:cholest-4-en-3-one 26-monooxygenase